MSITIEAGRFAFCAILWPVYATWTDEVMMPGLRLRLGDKVWRLGGRTIAKT